MPQMDVAFLTIAELNRLYRQRELSPVEVTKALLARIAAHDEKLHSFLRVTEEIALAEATAAERELMAAQAYQQATDWHKRHPGIV
jgi:Asp-tRNA(Asn)/Glu-tRNA(Gln) amidotransferase A subunit family amidase